MKRSCKTGLSGNGENIIGTLIYPHFPFNSLYDQNFLVTQNELALCTECFAVDTNKIDLKNYLAPIKRLLIKNPS